MYLEPLDSAAGARSPPEEDYSQSGKAPPYGDPRNLVYRTRISLEKVNRRRGEERSGQLAAEKRKEDTVLGKISRKREKINFPGE